ncbi:MAG: aldehyde dehydrogenase family protein, partial [Acidimicrobiales bacterium]
VAVATEARRRPFPAWERAQVLETAARRLSGRAEEFASRIAGEAAKPLKSARTETARAVSTFTFAAVEARRLAGEVVPLDAAPAGASKLGFTLRLPVGVVAAITPFNFPLNLVAHKLAPAIAAGCPVVLKPATATPLTALALVELLETECGLPAGWVSVVVGRGATVGDALATHPDVAMVSFTGSADVGWGIRARAPRKKVSLELGNNSPVIVEADADWQKAVKLIAAGGFSHAGQSCVSTQRVYVHEAIEADFCAALVDAVEALALGDPLDPGTDVSVLISGAERDRVMAWVAEACAEGAKALTGAAVSNDGIVQPTVLASVKPTMRVSREEIFGPVVAVASYREFADARDQANDTRYGLQAGVFTANLRTALDAARTLDFGTVLINEVPTWRADQMPYGGVRDSGNTREGPAYAVQEMTQPRLVVIDP